MSPLPWPLIGRTRRTPTPAPATAQPARTLATVTRVPPPAPAPAVDAQATATRYLDLTNPGAWPGAPLWLIAESSVIARLADAGGDLQAHRALFAPDITAWPKDT